MSCSDTSRPAKQRNFLSRSSTSIESCRTSVLTNEQFIDLCILMGCDYCATIKGIGPKRAIDLIKQHGSIEEILENIDPNKHPAPEDWLYKEARGLFLKPEVVDCSTVDLKWNEPDEDALIQVHV
ncbi:Flap endonuclease 1 [Larimichthys crocea]|uniref:Uncharacterized protein n=1 Tax=Larimichthys crocea TaxID=215358 RepID=A0ACD3QQS5_LARCR|nr:Flap endonuclease 1 [Larimichthys crocea]